MPTVDRHRRRRGGVRIRAGIPYDDPRTTLSLLPGAVLGRWLARHTDRFSGLLLDDGCGNRPYADWYAPLVTGSVGLDVVGDGGADVVGYADRLPFADASFDTVLATELLEHVANPDAAVAEAFRVLRPGGHALFSVPFLYPTHEAPHDYVRFTRYGLRDILVRNGFHVVTLDAKGGFVLLVVHFLVLAATNAANGIGRRLGFHTRPFTEVNAARWIFVQPQLAASRFCVPRGVDGLAGVVSLGYMAVARRPEQGPEG
jgi:SAM-dependent methyltransferase